MWCQRSLYFVLKAGIVGMAQGLPSAGLRSMMSSLVKDDEQGGLPSVLCVFITSKCWNIIWNIPYKDDFILGKNIKLEWRERDHHLWVLCYLLPVCMVHIVHIIWLHLSVVAVYDVHLINILLWKCEYQNCHILDLV